MMKKLSEMNFQKYLYQARRSVVLFVIVIMHVASEGKSLHA